MNLHDRLFGTKNGLWTRIVCAGLSAGALCVGAAPTSAVATPTITYQYDVLGRLVQVNYGNGATTTYTYDAAGNRTQTVVVIPPPIVLPLMGGYVLQPR